MVPASTNPFVTAGGERRRVMLVRLRHPRGFQTQNEITSLLLCQQASGAQVLGNVRMERGIGSAE